MNKPATLQDLIELAGKQAKLVMIGLGQDLMPSWVMINDQGKVFVVGTPWQDDFEKHVARIALQKKIREEHIVAYSFVLEAWTTTKPADWTPTPDYQGASQEPDRQEIVMAYATDGKEQQFRTWAIQRGTNEKVCALELMPDKKEALLQGWMTELLKPLSRRGTAQG